MKSKKILSLVMAVALTLSVGVVMSGCGSDKDASEAMSGASNVAKEEAAKESTEPELDPARAQEVVAKAEKILELLPKSKMGLSGYLAEFEGLTAEEAVYAVNNCNADWNEEAVEYAYYILGATPDMSLDDMQGQLEYEGFAPAEITYALDKVY